MNQWKTYKIDQLKSKHKTSISIGPFGSRMKSDCYVFKGIPVIRGNNISDTPNFIGSFVFIAEEQSKDFKSSKVYKNDLVFPHRGNIGEVGIVTETQYKEYIISSSLMKLSCNTDFVSPKFLYYFFKSNQGRKKLLENSSQVGTPGIATPLTSLKNIEIRLPLLPEQEQIADILSCLDAKIENLRRQNETLEQIAQTLFKHWFIDFEFPNADGKPYKSSGGVMFASELGDIPEGWRVGKLGEIALFKNGQSPPARSEDFNIPIYGSNGIIGKTNVFNYQNIVIIGRVGSYCGSLYYFLDKCWVTDNAMTGQIKNGNSQAFLYFVLKVNRLNRLSTGSGQPLLNQAILSSIELVLAKQEIIQRFEITVKPIFEKMLLNNQQIQTLTKIRDSLLPKLMSGQLRVKE